MGIRAAFQKVIDEFQFVCDVFPNGDYQPLPWIGMNTGQRAEGTRSRWKAIDESLNDGGYTSGMDIGCNLGFFCFMLAERGIPMLGVDLDGRYLRIAQYASGKIGLPTVGFCKLRITIETVRLLPKVDLILLLSVWHHWVREYGIDNASLILSGVWERAGRAMFFETGESEMTADFGIPNMGDSPKQWLENYLAAICVGGDITHLGLFKAFAPSGGENRNVVYRNLFKISRHHKP